MKVLCHSYEDLIGPADEQMLDMWNHLCNRDVLNPRDELEIYSHMAIPSGEVLIVRDDFPTPDGEFTCETE